MATTIDGTAAVVNVTTTEEAITLNPQRSYTFAHLGRDTSGVPITDPIYLSQTTGFTPDDSANADKVTLLDGREATLGPGIATLYARMAATSVPVNMQVVPSAQWLGDF